MANHKLNNLLAVGGLAVALTACSTKGNDGHGLTGLTSLATTGNTGNSSNSSTASNTTNNNSGSGSGGGTTGASSITTSSMTTGMGGSTGGCTPNDQCMSDADCNGGSCVSCFCVGGSSSASASATATATGGGTGGFPTMSDYGSCDMCAAGEMPVTVMGVTGCFCSPGCAMTSDCATPNSGTAQPQCVLSLDMSQNPTNCALVCDPSMQGMCPTGATCQPVPMQSGVGICMFPSP